MQPIHRQGKSLFRRLDWGIGDFLGMKEHQIGGIGNFLDIKEHLCPLCIKLAIPRFFPQVYCQNMYNLSSCYYA